jgi:hypothetical protein
MSNTSVGNPPSPSKGVTRPSVTEPSEVDDVPATLAAVFKAIAGVGVVATIVAALWFGRVAAFSVAFGAFLGFANLMLLGRMVRAFLAQSGVSLPWVVAALVKLAVLLLAMYLPVRAHVLELLPFVCGFGALPVGIVCGQFLSVPSSSKAN